MCRRVTCRDCGKATFSGCGQHVDQVLRGVPQSERCRCGQGRAPDAGAAGRRSLLRRLRGR